MLFRYSFSCYVGTLFRVMLVHFSVLFRYTFPCNVGTLFSIMSVHFSPTEFCNNPTINSVLADSTDKNWRFFFFLRTAHSTIILIDIAIPGDSNVIKKEAEKILRYKDHIIQIQHM